MAREPLDPHNHAELARVLWNLGEKGAALERLEDHFKTTGVRLSLLGAVDAFLGAVGSVKRKLIAEAVEAWFRNDESIIGWMTCWIKLSIEPTLATM